MEGTWWCYPAVYDGGCGAWWVVLSPYMAQLQLCGGWDRLTLWSNVASDLPVPLHEYDTTIELEFFCCIHLSWLLSINALPRDLKKFKTSSYFPFCELTSHSICLSFFIDTWSWSHLCNIISVLEDFNLFSWSVLTPNEEQLSSPNHLRIVVLDSQWLWNLHFRLQRGNHVDGV